ncbi:UNVERIFIED_CONTAM: amt-3 [Trichonephila clavipes]
MQKFLNVKTKSSGKHIKLNTDCHVEHQELIDFMDEDRDISNSTAAINTINASLGGGVTALLVTFEKEIELYVSEKLYLCYFRYLKNHVFGVSDTVNGILGALVGVTAGSAFLKPWESLIVGAICAIVVNESAPFLDKLNVDDPVGAVAVHGVGGILGMAAVGLFVEADPLLNMTGGLNGLFKGGGFYFLWIQLLSCVCTATWSMLTTFILLKVYKCFLL